MTGSGVVLAAGDGRLDGLEGRLSLVNGTRRSFNLGDLALADQGEDASQDEQDDSHRREADDQGEQDVPPANVLPHEGEGKSTAQPQHRCADDAEVTSASKHAGTNPGVLSSRLNLRRH